jgi:hypothetical protein
MSAHEQVWVKVNAPADSGIASLIEAMSRFPELQTASSCQGFSDRPASITFRYGLSTPDKAWHQLSEFVLGRFGPQLMKRVGDSATLALEFTTWGETLGHLSIRPGCIKQVAEAVESIADETC